MIKQSFKVNEVRCGRQPAEVMAVQVIIKDGERYYVTTTYVPLESQDKYYRSATLNCWNFYLT